MMESFMEDLLWKYPDDFFPREGFKQAERQFTLSDGGRLDISFRDANERLWVIEVKAIPIRLDVVNQVIRYVENMRAAHPNDHVIPAVVAPVINPTVRELFDKAGIEHYEISEATFRRVATERGVAVEPTEPTRDTPAAKPTRTTTKAAAGNVNVQQAMEDNGGTLVMPAGWYTVAWAGGGKWANAALWRWHYNPGNGGHHAAITKHGTQYYLPGPIPEGQACITCSRRYAPEYAQAP